MGFPATRFDFADDLGIEVVDIYVGPDRKRYVVHKKLLTSQSEYFDKALNGSFKEAAENSVHLNEEEPSAVALLVGWLYRGVIPGTDKSSVPFPNNAFLSPKGFVTIPIAQQGTRSPFIVTHGSSGSSLFDGQDAFQHIGFQSQYVNFSPEELRVADYKFDQRYQSDLPSNFAGGQSASLPSQSVLGGGPLSSLGAGTTQPSHLGLFGRSSRGGINSLFNVLGNQPSQLATSNAAASHTTNIAAVFGGLAPQMTPSQASATSLFHNPTAQALQNTLTPGISLFPPVVQIVQPSPFSQLLPIQNRSFSTSDANSTFSSSAATLTFPHDRPKSPSEFGYYPTIKPMKSPGVFIDGIPRSENLNDQFSDLEKQQLAFLHLCILAETFCWPSLFNDAIDAYLRGEFKLHRSITLEHIDLIYDRTHADSKLRSYVIDSVSRIGGRRRVEPSAYIEMAQKHEEFLTDIVELVLGSRPALESVMDDETTRGYHMILQGNAGDGLNGSVAK